MIEPAQMSLKLLPPSALIKTGPVDHADWNFLPALGLVQRLRFRIICRLLDGLKPVRLLELGYGSGVFMPELASRCAELYGLDLHEKHDAVRQSLGTHGVDAELRSGTAEHLPYDDGMFDCVVAVSVLEYVDDIERASSEITRVLAPAGKLVLVTPGSSPLWDVMLRLSTGESASQYSDRRQRLIPALRRAFAQDRELAVPALGGRALRLYTGLRLTRR